MAQAKNRGGKKNAGPEQPSKADRKAQAEAAIPIEAVAPGVEHEDHEGGETDSLARSGARAPLLTTEEKQELVEEEQKDGILRAPSVRERQTGMAAVIARGGAVRPARASDEELADRKFTPPPRGAHDVIASREGARIVAVVATRVGQYPADGRLRNVGEAFDYAMQADEEKLPSWMKDPTGAIESREQGAPTSRARVGPANVIEVGHDGTVAVRGGTATEVNARLAGVRTTSSTR